MGRQAATERRRSRRELVAHDRLHSEAAESSCAGAPVGVPALISIDDAEERHPVEAMARGALRGVSDLSTGRESSSELTFTRQRFRSGDFNEGTERERDGRGNIETADQSAICFLASHRRSVM